MMSSRQTRRVINEETGEIAKETAGFNPGGIAAGLASAVALIFSGISLYHSVLKQPELRLYIPPTVHYTRDPATEGEVIILPLTIANHGARDGTVLDLKLTVEAVASGERKTFRASYSASEDFFVQGDRFNMQTKRFDRTERPRTPFAPISVAGRTHYTGPLLFTRIGKSAFPRVIADAGRFRMTLEVETVVDQTLGIFDRAFITPVPPVVFEVEGTRPDDRRLKLGNTMPLRRVDRSD